MGRKRLVLVAGLLVASVLFFQVYESTILHWDGFALEVFPVTDVDPELLVSIDPSELTGYPEVVAALESTDDGPIMVTEFNAIDQFFELLESKGYDLDYSEYFLEVDDEIYLVSYATYGGMEETPAYLYLSAAMFLLAVGLVISIVIEKYRA